MSSSAVTSWQAVLEKDLPLLGHRNWIVLADSAYPWQTAPGVKTISTGGEQLEVVQAVLQAVDDAPHVRPIIYTDAELPFLPEEDAPGITAYCMGLKNVLVGRSVHSLPHDRIIALLDEAGRAFHILLFKTTMTLPYTTVFVQLDCGYWSPQAEQKLREKFVPAVS